MGFETLTSTLQTLLTHPPGTLSLGELLPPSCLAWSLVLEVGGGASEQCNSPPLPLQYPPCCAEVLLGQGEEVSRS